MAKILGLFRISFVNGGKSQRMDFVVMENLFYDRNISRVSAAREASGVLL